MLPATGSTRIAAISGPCCSTIRATASRSLKGASIVADATSAGTPAESGVPKVAAPDPAATSSGSTCPW
jgi:hypothetical protein